MSSRHPGVISIERYLAVERYRESHPAPSTQPLPRPGVDGNGRRIDTREVPANRHARRHADLGS
jgi:hypothetical protein